MAKSQGPFTFVYLSTGVPLLLRNRSDPGSGVPLLLGNWPTTTNPRFRTPSAVVKPPPVGDKKIPLKKVEVSPSGDTLVIVVPVPWILPLGEVPALLKFDTKISPGLSGPPDGKPCGTNATP